MYFVNILFFDSFVETLFSTCDAPDGILLAFYL